MKNSYCARKIFVVGLFIQIISSQLFAQIGSIIPSDRRVDWRSPGYEGDIPRYIQNYVNVKTQYIDLGQTATQAVNNAMTNAHSWNVLHPGCISVLYFPAGDYSFTSSITLFDSIIIKGDGSDKTNFTFNDGGFVISKSDADAQLDATGDGLSLTKINASDYNSSTKTLNIDLTNQSGINWKTDWLDKNVKNRFFEIKVPNGYWANGGDQGGAINYVGQIVKVQSYTSSSITFVDDIGLTLSFAGTGDNRAAIGRINPITVVGFEDFKISSNGDQNTHFSFNRAADCWISGVESYNPGIEHIGISASSYIEVRGCYLYEAKHVCTGGEGYGIVLANHSTDCLIEDNIIRRLRHSMIACIGANRNVFGYNFSCDRHAQDQDPVYHICYDQNGVEPDMLFHGRFSYANLIEGNVVDAIAAEVVHGMNGPYNTIFRNRAKSDLAYSTNGKCLNTTSEGGIFIKDRTEGTSGCWLMSDCQYFNIYGNTVNDSRSGEDLVWLSCGISDGYNGEGSLQDTP